MKNRLIVFKIPQFPHLSETFIIAQILTAKKLGYDIKIVTRKFISSNVELIENLELVDKIIVEDYKIPKNKILRFFKWVLLVLFNFIDIHFIFRYYQLQNKFSLTWLFHWVFYKQFNNASIFHVQYGTNSNPLPLLKKTNFFKPRLVVTFHGHDAFFPLYGYIKNDGYYDDLFKTDVLITANTPYLANKILELGCPTEKLKTVPIAVNTNFFHFSEENREKDGILKLITVGRLDKVKGHKYAIEVLRKLKDKQIKATLTIVGEGDERSNLEGLIKQHNLENAVFLLGAKKPIDVRAELWNHDVYLLLAIPVENNRRETQGLATLEAQACGLPVIAFDSGGIKYTIKDGETGFGFKEFDIDMVTQKIEFLNQNRKIIKAMGKNAVHFVETNFSQSVMDNKWGCIYKSINNE